MTTYFLIGLVLCLAFIACKKFMVLNHFTKSVKHPEIWITIFLGFFKISLSVIAAIVFLWPACILIAIISYFKSKNNL